MRMRTIGVHSGETEQLNKLKDEWVSLMNKPDIPWTYEELLEEKGSISVNDVVRKFKLIPRFQYVVNYLMMYFQYVLEGEEKQEFFAYLGRRKQFLCQEILPDDASESYEPYAQLWIVLLDMLKNRFRENKIPKARCEISCLEKLILDFNEAGLRELALGLHMSADDVNVFLCQVLKRSGFNFYDKNDFLLYLVLNHAGRNSYYQCYEKLKKDYAKLAKDKNNGKIQQLCGADGYEPDVYDVRSRTRMVAEYADFILSHEKLTGIYEDDRMTTFGPAVRELLEWHKSIVHDRRTAQEEFHKLYFRAKECYAEELKHYHNVVEKSAGRLKGEGNLQISYDPGQEIILEEGTVFYSRKLIRKPEFYEERVDFYLPEKVVLKAAAYTSVSVPVVSLNRLEEGNVRKKLLTPGRNLQLAEGQSITEQLVSSIKTVKGVRRYASDKQQVGTIEVSCRFGCRIPAGTRFICEDMGETIVLESCQEVTADEFAEEMVRVICFNPKGIGSKRNKTDNYVVIADTGTICHMEKPADGIRKVRNPKPVLYQEIEEEENSVMTIPVEGKIRRGRAKDVNLPKDRDRFCVVGAVPDVGKVMAAGDFVKSGRVVEGNVKIECPIGTAIPFGTEFTCGDMVFQSREDEINISDSLFQRYFYAPDNQTGYQETVDVKLFRDWFEKTRIDHNLLHNFSDNGNEKERNCLMTLQFLIYEAEMESVYEDSMERLGRIYKGFDDKDSFADFQEEMDRILLRCGMQTFHMGNPYDCLLAFLFLSADSSVSVLRTLWSVTGGD